MIQRIWSLRRRNECRSLSLISQMRQFWNRTTLSGALALLTPLQPVDDLVIDSNNSRGEVPVAGLGTDAVDNDLVFDDDSNRRGLCQHRDD